MGFPLLIDQATIMREVGHFARVLVNIDLAQTLPSYVLLDTDDGSIDLSVSYEHMLEFCTACNTIGHGISTCWFLERQAAS